MIEWLSLVVLHQMSLLYWNRVKWGREWSFHPIDWEPVIASSVIPNNRLMSHMQTAVSPLLGPISVTYYRLSIYRLRVASSCACMYGNHKWLHGYEGGYLSSQSSQYIHQYVPYWWAPTRAKQLSMSLPSEWGRRSFMFRTLVEWSNLPLEIRNIVSASLFKRALKSLSWTNF